MNDHQLIQRHSAAAVTITATASVSITTIVATFALTTHVVLQHLLHARCYYHRRIAVESCGRASHNQTAEL